MSAPPFPRKEVRDHVGMCERLLAVATVLLAGRLLKTRARSSHYAPELTYQVIVAKTRRGILHVG